MPTIAELAVYLDAGLRARADALAPAGAGREEIEL
jgi:hypothetical protein